MLLFNLGFSFFTIPFSSPCLSRLFPVGYFSTVCFVAVEFSLHESQCFGDGELNILIAQNIHELINTRDHGCKKVGSHKAFSRDQWDRGSDKRKRP